MTMAEKILSLRTERGMSQDDLAERLEVSRQSVSKWETGQSTPDLDKIIRLADLFGLTVDELVRDGERPQPPEPPQPQVVYVERKRKWEPPELTAVQKIGLIFEAAGTALTIIGLLGEDWPLVYKMVPLVFLSLPLLLAKKHPWLTLCWVLMALSFVFLRPQQTAWGLVDGLEHLYYYFKLQDPHYSSYAASSDHSYLLFMGIVGIVRGLLTLVLIIFTGRACGKAWKEKRFPEKDG